MLNIFRIHLDFYPLAGEQLERELNDIKKEKASEKISLQFEQLNRIKFPILTYLSIPT